MTIPRGMRAAVAALVLAFALAASGCGTDNAAEKDVKKAGQDAKKAGDKALKKGKKAVHHAKKAVSGY